MGYYIAKVNFESGDSKRNGDPVIVKLELLVPAESLLEAETKVVEHMRGSGCFFETVQISKSKIEAVLD